jgi:CRISPR-associated protein Cas5h
MLAAVMGEEKDTYYKKYQDENIQVGIRVLSEIKKSFHRLNFLKITSKDDFTGRSGRIQTPFEIVTGNDLKEQSVKYRIYLASGRQRELYYSIKNKLLSDNRKFNISLGIAGFSAFISNIGVIESEPINAENDWINIHSACNSDQVLEIDFPDDPEVKLNHIEEELLPADFIGGDKGRELDKMNRVLFATRPFPMHVKLNGTYYPLSYDGEIENIQFLEYAGVFSQQT